MEGGRGCGRRRRARSHAGEGIRQGTAVRVTSAVRWMLCGGASLAVGRDIDGSGRGPLGELFSPGSDVGEGEVLYMVVSLKKGMNDKNDCTSSAVAWHGANNPARMWPDECGPRRKYTNSIYLFAE